MKKSWRHVPIIQAAELPHLPPIIDEVFHNTDHETLERLVKIKTPVPIYSPEAGLVGIEKESFKKIYFKEHKMLFQIDAFRMVTLLVYVDERAFPFDSEILRSELIDGFIHDRAPYFFSYAVRSDCR